MTRPENHCDASGVDFDYLLDHNGSLKVEFL